MKLRPYIRLKRLYLTAIALSLPLFIVVNIILQTAIALYLQPNPQAIFTLGGGRIREEFTAEFAKAHPSLPIWVSSGIVRERAYLVFSNAGISLQRLRLDGRATDTVTNFTTLVATFQDLNIKHLYLITSDYHMPRAKAIGYVVFGSNGIAFTPVAIATAEPPEATIKTIRDLGRSVLWLFTKRTGSSLRDRQI